MVNCKSLRPLPQFGGFAVLLNRKGTYVAQAQPGEEKRPSQAGGAAESLTPEALVRTYASAVLGVCLAHTRNIHDSEDIMQDVFIKAFTKPIR